MDRHDLRKLSDDALAESVMQSEIVLRATETVQQMEHDRDKLMKQLKHTADALRELLDATNRVSRVEMPERDATVLEVAMKGAAEVLAICATYVHK